MTQHKKHRSQPTNRPSQHESNGQNRGTESATTLQNVAEKFAGRWWDRLPENILGRASFLAGGIALGLGASYWWRRARPFTSAYGDFSDDDRPVIDVMSAFPSVCTPETPLREIAERMVEVDCGAIPVVEDEMNRRPIGIITDRDIVVRALAHGKNPLELVARDCMTAVTITVPDTSSVFEAVDLMQEHAIRRLIVVDDGGRCVGILAQADVALELQPVQTQELVGEVSAGTGSTRGPAAAQAEAR